MRAVPLGLFVLAVVVRAVVALRTLVPDRDASAYLWMADQVAAGRIEAAFGTVFHPLYSLLVAAVLWCAPALGSVLAGQLVACGAGALAVLPLFALTQRMFGRSAAVAAGVLYAVGIWFARHPADCLSEGLFYLLVASAVSLLVREERGAKQLLGAGLLAGLAYGTRPEGATLLVVGAAWLWFAGARWWIYALGFAVTAAPWPLGWARWGGGFTLTPKASFNYAVGAGGEDSSVAHYFGHLAQVPGELFEALGYVATPMILVGLFLARPWKVRHPATLVASLFAVQIAVVPLLFSHIRFLSGYGCLMLAFAGLTVRVLWPHTKSLPAVAVALLGVVAVTGDLVRLPAERRADRVVLIDVGTWLRPRLQEGETIATDMPRLAYFAGVEPGPPRRITREDILEACKSSATRYAVVVASRTAVTEDDLRSAGFEPEDVPTWLRAKIAEREMLIYRRSR